METGGHPLHKHRTVRLRHWVARKISLPNLGPRRDTCLLCHPSLGAPLSASFTLGIILLASGRLLPPADLPYRQWAPATNPVAVTQAEASHSHDPTQAGENSILFQPHFPEHTYPPVPCRLPPLTIRQSPQVQLPGNLGMCTYHHALPALPTSRW